MTEDGFELHLELVASPSAPPELNIRFRWEPGDGSIRNSHEPVRVQFRPEYFNAAQADPDAYSSELTSLAFPPGIREMFIKAAAAAKFRGVPLRLRLVFGADAVLSALAWERLRFPEDDGSVLGAGIQVLLSRYVSPSSRVDTRTRTGKPRVLIAVASPSELLELHDLPRLDRERIVEEVRGLMKDFECTDLGGDGPVSLTRLSEVLDKGVDLVYLVAHGVRSEEGAAVLLDTDPRVEGSGREDVDRLAAVFTGCKEKPLLVVLASCYSAHDGRPLGVSEVSSTLAPKLALAGVPAVLGMQGQIETSSLETFFPSVFKELADGEAVDLAVSKARDKIRLGAQSEDWWIPALYMHHKDGHLPWPRDSRRQPSPDGSNFGWQALLRDIKEQRCLPVLGPGLNAAVLGDDLAIRLARIYGYPLAKEEHRVRSRVTSYVELTEGRRELLGSIKEGLRDMLVPSADERGERSFEDLLLEAGRRARHENPSDPYRVLASLRLPVYVTTDPGDLLKDALGDIPGCAPESDFCRWNHDLVNIDSPWKGDPAYIPSRDRPLVYHLLGRWSITDSLVLTEEDYFHLLSYLGSETDAVPTDVRGAFSTCSRMMLGFQFYEFDLRLLQFLSSRWSDLGKVRGKTRHAVVQLRPTEEVASVPELAEHFVNGYFREVATTVYWEPVSEFTARLHDALGAES